MPAVLLKGLSCRLRHCGAPAAGRPLIESTDLSGARLKRSCLDGCRRPRPSLPCQPGHRRPYSPERFAKSDAAPAKSRNSQGRESAFRLAFGFWGFIRFDSSVLYITHLIVVDGPRLSRMGLQTVRGAFPRQGEELWTTLHGPFPASSVSPRIVRTSRRQRVRWPTWEDDGLIFAH